MSCSGARIPIGMSVYCRASRRRGRRTPENREFIGVRHALFGYHGRPGRTWTVGSMVRLFWTCRWANTVRSDLRRSCAAHALLTTGGAVIIQSHRRQLVLDCRRASGIAIHEGRRTKPTTPARKGLVGLMGRGENSSFTHDMREATLITVPAPSRGEEKARRLTAATERRPTEAPSAVMSHTIAMTSRTEVFGNVEGRRFLHPIRF